MFKFNQDSSGECSACGKFHEGDNESQKPESPMVEYVEIDAEAEIEDAVAYFKEHVNSEDELRQAISKVYQAGYMHGIQISLVEQIEENMEALKGVQTFWED